MYLEEFGGFSPELLVHWRYLEMVHIFESACLSILRINYIRMFVIEYLYWE